MTAIDMLLPAWEGVGHCFGPNPELWFSSDPALQDEAKQICHQCPVIDACRDFTDHIEGDTNILYGIAAAETPKQRRARRNPDMPTPSPAVGEITNCRHCKRPVRPPKTRATDHPGTTKNAGRGLCDPCYRNHRNQYPPLQARSLAMLNKVDDLYGHTPKEIAERLNTTVTAIEQAALRHNRPDIALTYSQARRQQDTP